MSTDQQPETIEHDVLDLVNSSNNSASGVNDEIFIAYLGREGFQISDPPTDPMGMDLAEFGVPEEYGTTLHYALVSNLRPQLFVGMNGKRGECWPADNRGLRAIQKSNGRSGDALIFNNKFLPGLRFKPGHLTSVPRWLAESLLKPNVRNLFAEVDEESKYEEWPIVGSTDGQNYAPTITGPRRRGRRSNAEKAAEAAGEGGGEGAGE